MRRGGWPEGSAGMARTQRGQDQETNRAQAERRCGGSEKRRGRGTRGASRNGKPRSRHPPPETLRTGAREGGGVGPKQQSRGGHGVEPGGTYALCSGLRWALEQEPSQFGGARVPLPLPEGLGGQTHRRGAASTPGLSLGAPPAGGPGSHPRS